MRRITLVLLTVAAVLVPSGAAFAHAGVKSMSPRPNSTASTSIRYVTARFTEAIRAGSIKVHKGSRTMSAGRATLIRNKSGLHVRMRSNLPRGMYHVIMRWVADDGDVQSKSWMFTLR